MRRKKFIHRLAMAGSSTLVLPSISLLQSCRYEPKSRSTLSATDIPLLDAIAETIMPATDSVPGAKAAKVGAYVLLMYEDCLDREDQARLVAAVNAIDARSSGQYRKAFSELEPAARLDIVQSLQTEAIDHNSRQVSGELGPHHFDILKGLTLTGYFTSEIGMTVARSYLPVPGKYQGCLPYSGNDRTWAL